MYKVHKVLKLLVTWRSLLFHKEESFIGNYFHKFAIYGNVYQFVSSQAHRKNWFVFVALLFDYMINHMMWPIVFFGNHQEPIHGQTKYLFARLLDVVRQDFYILLIKVFLFLVWLWNTLSKGWQFLLLLKCQVLL